MKTNNKKKVVVSVLALAMGAGLAGSISGSVAWYQYSTRTTAQLQGVSTGTIRNLRVRIADGGTAGAAGDWMQDLTVESINSYLGIDSSDENKPDKLTLNPVTIRTLDGADEGDAAGDKDGALATRTIGEAPNQQTVPAFFGHPVYQYPALPEINSKTAGSGANLTYNYVQIPLEFDLTDNDTRIARELYLVDARFNDLSDNSHADITPALRAHFSSSTANALLANNNSDLTTNVSGALDLNKNTESDRDDFVGTDTDTTKNIINYGNHDGSRDTKTAIAENDILKQVAYANAEGEGKLLADDTNAYDFAGGIALGTTTTQNDYLKVTLTIWLEGWSELNVTGSNPAAASNIWGADYIGSDFGLQLRFACEAEA